ncbi:sigma-54-dependent Fis family transcriptional regulator [Desulfoluna butyratoxydans]|uniref:Signal transduction response regulator receiver domain n=1 Tax=Desulfoluna butyratoxydans TaxID=231438 RepID=A0A4U8YLU8_9BACT|nr:sigma-54-dependent Fis family transcriptional regulator [Desulfoluna butyratoxydans]VFQ44630.1 signal transduction response regulator receiver domain [Desulfoluna butyratoxydans]
MKNPLNVLIVEDSEDDAFLIIRRLRKDGLRPHCERVDGEAEMRGALASRRWDVIISDYDLPGFGGIEALELWKASGMDIPFIMVSGVLGEDVAVEVMKQGAHDYLIKDRLDRLVPAIERELRDAADRRKRVVVERALDRSEVQYRLLTEQIADGISLTQNGRYLFVNSAFAEIFGYPDTECLVGRNAFHHLVEGKREVVLDWVRQLEEGEGGPDSFQGQCIGGDGRAFWVGANLRAITWQGSNAVLLTVRDITEVKEKERRLEEESALLRTENRLLRSSMKDRYRFGGMIGKSVPMQHVYELVAKAAATEAGVVVYGESGTGKELAARAIHDMSDRRGNHFVPVNCGAIPEELLESEFFGYAKGAFSGAHSNKPGYLDHADGGTLFLDEIGEISLNIQVKLLRAIEGGGYSPLGSVAVKKPDIRIIAATNRDLEALVRAGSMREDFYYRIHIIPIYLPPLKERREDIPLLVEYFTNAQGGARDAAVMDGRSMHALLEYGWPGNIRELQNVVRRYLTLGTLELEGVSPTEVPEPEEADVRDLQAAMKCHEKKLLLMALEKNRWHRGNTARYLNLPARTFYKKMKDHQLNSA